MSGPLHSSLVIIDAFGTGLIRGARAVAALVFAEFVVDYWRLMANNLGGIS